MTPAVRVRFAPSPTGHLHIGGLRTAFFNWLYARHTGGVFLLRIEDTDLERSKSEYTASILEALAWADIKPDEESVIQSQRIEEHKRYIQQLLEQGKAYKCYCPVNPDASQEGTFFKYSGQCRLLTPQQPNQPYVVRLRLPLHEQTLTFFDIIRGELNFDLSQLDDFVIARSDGSPVYNFVVVIDDAAMNITHVIRGEDHISNTPKQILLYQALGFKVPQFAHIPLILAPSGARLSKRDAATAVLDYRAQGYLPEALCNYLVRLGWAHGDQEIFTRDELIALFTLEAVGKKGSIFDQEKLNWVNSIYMRNTGPQRLLEMIIQYVDPALRTQCAQWSDEQLCELIKLYRERVSTLKAIAQEIRQLYGPVMYDTAAGAPFKNQQIHTALAQVREALSVLGSFSVEDVEKAVKQVCAEFNLKLGVLGQPLRYALTGGTASPGIFHLMAVLGKDETLRRIEHGIAHSRV
jgi:glutamyl-tRNA synthetase